MTIVIVIISMAIFCALILNLAAKPKVTRGLAGLCTFLAAVGGLAFYGIGFACTLENPVLAVIRTLFCVSRMFAGVNELGAISAAPIFEIPGMVLLFWVLHFMAFYAMASATISTIGAQALKKLKFWLQRYGKTTVIYGTTNDSVEFGRNLIGHGSGQVIFVSSKCDPALESSINSMGGLYRSDAAALKPNLAFLKSVGAQKGAPVLVLYALDPDANKNQTYASTLLQVLEENEVDPSNTALILRTTEEETDCQLAAGPDRYGYGDVKLFTEVSLAARTLMQEMPPYRKMSFNGDQACAKGDFDSVIIGFGRTGSEVLRHLVRDSQFAGSDFHAAVFTTDGNRTTGYFYNAYPALMEAYDIRFYEEDARSCFFYDYLREHAESLRYLVICTGSEQRDSELRVDITSFLRQLGSDCAITTCSSRSVSWCQDPQSQPEYRDIYSSDRIMGDSYDRLGMYLNYSYVNDPAVTPEQAWKSCDFFSRESSRASADYIHTFAAMTGMTEEDIDQQGWEDLTEIQKENLGRTEHLRWCAFHYSMGFRPMIPETVKARGEIYLQQKASGSKPSIRITKDLAGRQHACLCDWEELDNLATLEQTFTGKWTDYKDMDIRNVLALPTILKASKDV